jgi:hypothetical protein
MFHSRLEFEVDDGVEAASFCPRKREGGRIPYERTLPSSFFCSVRINSAVGHRSAPFLRLFKKCAT